jgi:hypothetical protein
MDSTSDREDDATDRKLAHMIEAVTRLSQDVHDLRNAPPTVVTAPSDHATRGSDDVSMKDVMDRLKLQEEIIMADREEARRGRKGDVLAFLDSGCEEFTTPGTDAKSGLRDELDSFNLEMKDHARWQIDHYDAKKALKMKLPLGLQEHVGPTMVARSYKKGRSMTTEWDEWLERKGLKRSSIAPEIKILTRSMDADVKDRNSRCLEMESFEVRGRRLYGFSRSFQNVTCESDWRKPAGPNSKGWKSKVQWGFLDLYDVPALEKEGIAIEKVDEEAEVVMNKQNKFEGYVSRVSAAQAHNPQARERVIVPLDDD